MSETLEAKRSYTSRWNNPKWEGDTKIRPRDVEIFKLLLRYKYLPTKHLAALLGDDVPNIQLRARQLRRAGFLYCELAQKDHYKALYRDLVYSLDKKGLSQLINRGMDVDLPVADSGYAHQLLIDEALSSFDLWKSPELSVEFIDLPDGGVPVTIKINGVNISTHVEADGKKIRLTRIEADRKIVRDLILEADIGTEPIETGDFGRSSVKKKVALYAEIMKKKLVKEYFGRDNLYIMIVTGERARLISMKEKLAPIMGDYARFFLFKVLPNFHSYADQRPPSDHMIKEDWERAGLPNFNLTTS